MQCCWADQVNGHIVCASWNRRHMFGVKKLDKSNIVHFESLPGAAFRRRMRSWDETVQNFFFTGVLLVDVVVFITAFSNPTLTLVCLPVLTVLLIATMLFSASDT